MKIIIICLIFLAACFAEMTEHERYVRQEMSNIWTETTNLRQTMIKQNEFARTLREPGSEARRKKTIPNNDDPIPGGSVLPQTAAGICPLYTGMERAGVAPASMTTNDPDNLRCPVFKDSSCCSADNALFLTGALDIDVEECEHIVGDLRCAVCDPDSSTFTVTFSSNQSEIVVCLSFCHTLYDRCVGARNNFFGNNLVIGANVTKDEFCAGDATGREDLRRLANFTSGCYDEVGAAGGKTGCFIATAAYGSDMNPHVWKLRVFRDQYLHGHPVGDKLVDLYYTYSPFIADWIAQHEWARTVTRMMLWPLVTIVETLFV